MDWKSRKQRKRYRRQASGGGDRKPFFAPEELGAMGLARRDLQLIAKAIRHDWPIPAKHCRALVQAALMEMNASPFERNRLSAVRVILEADRANFRIFEKLFLRG